MIKKANIFSKTPLRKVNPDWFTGYVHMTEISGTINSKRQDIYHVTFEKGARTKLHVHDGDQILLATKGMGSLEIFSKHDKSKENFGIKKTQRILFNSGDIVFIPKGTLHTHGSVNKRQLFSHIAFNIISGKKYNTTWYESDFQKFASHIIR
jgi:quercetin dioxygenase-like cupin family protein